MFHSSFEESTSTAHLELSGARFTEDVAVTGTLVRPENGADPTIDVTFIGPSGTAGRLHASGKFDLSRDVADPGTLPVTGTIDGHAVALLLPL